MSAKYARIVKYAAVPILAVVFASGGSALVGAHGTSADHRSATGVENAKDVTAPNEPSPSVSPSPDAADHEVARFHGDATTCAMPDGVTLQGNWTHGDYVSSWAKTGDHVKTQAAAQSDCGKPQSSVDKSKSHDSGDDATEVDDAKDSHDSQADTHREDGNHPDTTSEHGSNHGEAGQHGQGHEAENGD